jgi:hypothetical protein
VNGDELTILSFPYLESILSVRFEGFMAVTMKNDFFWEVMPYGSYKELSSPILSTLMMEATCSYISHMASHPRTWHSSTCYMIQSVTIGI